MATKTVITFINRKNNKEFTLDSIINDGTTFCLVDSNGENHLYSESTIKRNFKKIVTEVEVEEPKAETSKPKAENRHQKAAWKNIKHGYNWVVGGMENDVQDGNTEEMPPVEEIFSAVYGEVTCCTFDEGFCDTKSAPVAMRFAGKQFITDCIVYLLQKDGYEVPEELKVAKTKKTGTKRGYNDDPGEVAENEVVMRAFTGMLIGKFEITKQDAETITVTTHPGVELSFRKKDGKQIGAAKPQFANRIEI